MCYDENMEILGVTLSKAAIVFIVAFIIWVLSQVLSKKLVDILTIGTPTGKRLRTLNSLVRTGSSAVILVVATFMIVRELGFDIAPLLASAGIAGLAIGFGAQTLIKDIIAGAFILIENQFDEGDEVEILDKKGVVEKVTLRTVWLKAKDGTLHIIPNGSITVISNFSKK